VLVVLRELVMYSPVRVDVGQGFAVAISAILIVVSFGVGCPDQLSGTLVQRELGGVHR
jgi:hypothetical protein